MTDIIYNIESKINHLKKITIKPFLEKYIKEMENQNLQNTTINEEEGLYKNSRKTIDEESNLKKQYEEDQMDIPKVKKEINLKVNKQSFLNN